MHEILWTWQNSNPRPLQCDRGSNRGKVKKSCLLRLLCSKITIQLATLVACCFSISVPKLFPNCSRSMKQGKAISSSVLRIKVKKLKNSFASISIHSRFVSARMLNRLIMSRATQCPARINGYGITDASHILGFFIHNIF